jgi:hypothetical protein
VIAQYVLVLVAVLPLAGCNQLLGLDDPVAAIDAASDAAAGACEADELTCDGACVEVATSLDHCGRCDHACGGGICSDGVCLSFKVGRFPGAAHLAATADAVYVGHAGGVSSCPMPAGCGDATPTEIAIGVDGRHELTVAGDHVYFSVDVAGHQLWQCPIAGCGDAPLVLASSQMEALDFRSTAATLYWRRESTALSSCAVADCMGTLRDYPATAFDDGAYSLALDDGVLHVGTSVGIVPCPADTGCPEEAVPAPDSNTIEARFRVHAGVAYWFAGDQSPIGIYRCPLATSCFAETTTFAQDSAGVERLEVDATGVYWLNRAEGVAGLRHCPLAGCPSGGRGQNLVPPSTLRAIPSTFALGPGFAYWIEGDDVLAVARP